MLDSLDWVCCTCVWELSDAAEWFSFVVLVENEFTFVGVWSVGWLVSFSITSISIWVVYSFVLNPFIKRLIQYYDSVRICIWVNFCFMTTMGGTPSSSWRQQGSYFGSRSRNFLSYDGKTLMVAMTSSPKILHPSNFRSKTLLLRELLLPLLFLLSFGSQRWMLLKS